MPDDVDPAPKTNSVGSAPPGPAIAPIPATRGARVGAVIYDLLVTLGASLPGAVALFTAGESPGIRLLGIVLLGVFLLALCLYQVYLLSTSGQTFGKRALLIRIVRVDDGRNPGFGKAALLRSFVPALIYCIPVLGTIFLLVDLLSIFRVDRRCVHDLLAGTKVVMAEEELRWMGHPFGLSTLFFTEMWERLSYYGMRALLILYMIAPVEEGGLGIKVLTAGVIYGWYTMLVYAMGLPGGVVADRWLGQFGAIFLGGCVIALGHFSLTFPPLPFFFAGLGLIILGTGLLKPNITSMVGALYERGDARRDGGFSLYYLGINVGAFLAPFVCGTLGQKVGWHWGFGAAGVGMLLGLIHLVLGRGHLAKATRRIKLHKEQEKQVEHAAHRRLTPQEWKRLAVVGVLFIFSTIFFAAFEQAGSSLNLFADRWTRLDFSGWTLPSTWFQSLNPLFIILLAPVFSWLWISLGKRQPSSPAKFVYGLILLSLGFLLLVPASGYAQSTGNKVSPGWLVGVYLFSTLGELCLSPVGLSMVTKLAPPKIVGSLMGFWFLSNGLGNLVSGWVGGLFKTIPLWQLFGWVFLVPFCAGLLLLFMVKPLKRMMGGVN